VLAVALIALAFALPAAATVAGPRTDLVSRAPGPHGAAGDGNSSSPSISADGRYVAFASKATNLSDADRNGTVDIFVRDMKTGAVTLVSRADGTNGAAADQSSFEPDISADGRYVAFTSFASNLGAPAGPTSFPDEVYVRDLVAGTTILASRATGVAGTVSTDAGEPALSADGRHVAWTDGGSLAPADTNDTLDIYVRDLDTQTTELVSRPTNPAASSSGRSAGPAISADGRYVSFLSDDNMGTVDGDPPGSTTQDIFVRDRVTSTTTLVSVPGPGSRGCEPDYPTIASSGRYVAYECNQIWVRDLVAGTTTKATRTIGVSGPGDPASITPDGRYLAFVSNYRQDSPLVIGGGKEVFVRDLQQGVTVNASRGNGIGLLGDTSSVAPSISADGRFVAFASFSRDFSPIDGDRTNDVWRRRLVYTPDRPLPTCDDRAVTMVGTRHRDVLRGTPRPDVILGLGGNDVINGGGSNDLICGAGGNDTINGGRHAGQGDHLFGGPGNDRITIQVGDGAVSGGPGNDRIRGSDTNDSGDDLKGGPGADVILGLNNAPYDNDFIDGGGGPDSLFGGRGDDVIGGGPGNDLIRGGPGDDRISGGPGRDDVSPGPGQH
jgi:Tol biopolymer transport system component